MPAEYSLLCDADITKPDLEGEPPKEEAEAKAKREARNKVIMDAYLKKKNTYESTLNIIAKKSLNTLYLSMYKKSFDQKISELSKIAATKKDDPEWGSGKVNMNFVIPAG